MTEKEMIQAHGVKVGQIWKRKGNVPLSRLELEIVFVNAITCVLLDTERTLGPEFVHSIAGVEGRWGQPLVESIQRLKEDFYLIQEAKEDIVDVYAVWIYSRDESTPRKFFATEAEALRETAKLLNNLPCEGFIRIERDKCSRDMLEEIREKSQPDEMAFPLLGVRNGFPF